MKLNERSVAHYATCDSPTDHSGFLRKRVERHHHHAHHGTSYQRRWFVLKGNLLFYFEERESREPVGLVVLEGCTVELCEAAEEFAFAIRFDDAGAKAYVLVADGQAAMEAWVKALSRASFDYMRLVVRELEKQLEERHLSNPALLPVQEKPAVLENGYSTWGSGPDRDGGHSKPPPLPPRRRSSPVSPETACFAKLHHWYGQEIAALRRDLILFPLKQAGSVPCHPGAADAAFCFPPLLRQLLWFCFSAWRFAQVTSYYCLWY
uniref:Sesquipedalian n=1 Tax=Anser cygnoides TaxID=8845 RepID=A0A8B9EQ00_ANSCY